MCFYVEQSEIMLKVEKRFLAKVDKPNLFLQSDYIVGFSYPNLPVLLDANPTIIRTDFHWGLVPNWSKSIDIRKHTLNARIESLEEKPSFQNIVSNRCLVIATSYFDWQWQDEKGKVKERYKISSEEDTLFAFAGIYDSWINPADGARLNTFSIVTTEANELMSIIHNHKKRMPVLLKREDEKRWLDASVPVDEFAFPYEAKLSAVSF